MYRGIRFKYYISHNVQYLTNLYTIPICASVHQDDAAVLGLSGGKVLFTETIAQTMNSKHQAKPKVRTHFIFRVSECICCACICMHNLITERFSLCL